MELLNEAYKTLKIGGKVRIIHWCKPEQYVAWVEQLGHKVVLQPVIIEPYHYGFITTKFNFSLNMKIGIIVKTKEFEKAWNAFSFCSNYQKSGA